ncbi:hypothetical protein [Halomicrobium urmianum]|uniref:hypothetical protein n=1 Tax=Halomicrobium urmianum TaxID=1586233 RepID=UPI001CD9B839|nr:hypothetical protein [Halomicrobium urmianum]
MEGSTGGEQSHQTLAAAGALILVALFAGGIGAAVAATTGRPVLAYASLTLSTLFSIAVLYARDVLPPASHQERGGSPQRNSAKRMLADGGWIDNDHDAIGLLVEAGAGTRTSGGTISLRDDFESTWLRIASTIGGTDKGTEIFRQSLCIEADRATFVDEGDAYEVRIDDVYYGCWESEVAFRIDMAAAYLLKEKYDRWTDLSKPEQGEVLSVLRTLLDTCPQCGEPVTVGRGGRGDERNPYEVTEIFCTHCDIQLYSSPGSMSV